jgi:hypothetical protein
MKKSAAPKRLNLVDVGWKGTIQDNIFRWSNHSNYKNIRIYGYYLGLLKSGIEHRRNFKKGLLFTNVPEPSKGFNIFSENLALYETILHAEHASVKEYKKSYTLNRIVSYDIFQEKKLIHKIISPIYKEIFLIFKNIAPILKNKDLSDSAEVNFFVNKHFSMIFSSNTKQLNFFENLFHKENFGHFNDSYFNDNENFGFLDKIKFSFFFLLKRKTKNFTFWPYLYIKRNYLFGFDWLYKFFRFFQFKLSFFK